MGTRPLDVVVDGTAITGEPGGARVRFASLYAALARRGAISLTALLGPGSGMEHAFGDGGEGSARVRIVRPTPPAARLLGVLHGAARIAGREGADLFAAETLPLPRTGKIPQAATIHDVRSLHPGLAPLPRRIYASLFLRRNLERATAVVAVSRAMADEIAAHGLFPRDRIFVVPNAAPAAAGVDANRARELIEALGVGRPYVLCIGRLERRKNIPALLDAFEHAAGAGGADIGLVLAGSTAGPAGRALLERVRSSARLRGRVIAAGVVDEETKSALLGSALCLALPSLYEGFSLCLLEAMAAGVPVACSSIPAHWETAGKAALFFDPRDPVEMARAIERLSREENLRDDLRAQGRQQAARFSWERSAELLEEVYRSVV
jgi:glycosyltransferase involved in cell wall biosynthesis